MRDVQIRTERRLGETAVSGMSYIRDIRGVERKKGEKEEFRVIARRA